MKYTKPALTLEQQADLLLLPSAYPYVPRGSMGIPKNWQECPIWTPVTAGSTKEDIGYCA